MLHARVERVDEDSILLSVDSRSFSVPRSLLPETPVVGQTVILAAALHTPEQPIANPLAHDLLNSLLSPS